MLRRELLIVNDRPDPDVLLDQLRTAVRDLSAIAEHYRKDAARGRRLLRSGSIDAALNWARQEPSPQ